MPPKRASTSRSRASSRSRTSRAASASRSGRAASTSRSRARASKSASIATEETVLPIFNEPATVPIVSPPAPPPATMADADAKLMEVLNAGRARRRSSALQTQRRRTWGFWAAVIAFQVVFLLWCKWAIDMYKGH